MPRKLDYPRSSFKNALEIAETVHSLGGKCDAETCASKLGKKTSGAFSKKIGASVKHNLITTNKGILETTELFRSINTAYNDDEKKTFLTQSFFEIPTYKSIYERFRGNELPIIILDKLLIREYQVQESSASAISKYFVEGLKFMNLLSADNKIIKLENESESSSELEEEVPSNNEGENDTINPNSNSFENITSDIESSQNDDNHSSFNKDSFKIRISGPGIDTLIEISTEDDFIILDAILNKIKKSL
ncbi:MAG: hypothetical protein V3V16_13195 [Melioribacteraceae bacterium]